MAFLKNFGSGIASLFRSSEILETPDAQNENEFNDSNEPSSSDAQNQSTLDATHRLSSQLDNFEIDHWNSAIENEDENQELMLVNVEERKSIFERNDQFNENYFDQSVKSNAEKVNQQSFASNFGSSSKGWTIPPCSIQQTDIKSSLAENLTQNSNQANNSTGNANASSVHSISGGPNGGGSFSLTINIRNIPPNLNWKPEIDVQITQYDNQGNLVLSTVNQDTLNSQTTNLYPPLPPISGSFPQIESNSTESNLTDEPMDTDNVTLPEYNILLLGETGAGKSTTINALANYMKYGSFEEANQADEFVQLIPSKFTLPDPKTGKPFEIKSSGTDSNERPENDGNSSTQSPVGYTFKDKNRLIRIIDTPGMGDTRGAEIDKQNFELILSYLNYHKQLHGICILIKSNETRKTASFRYCISELLAHLHKSACRNIIFCFTFGRNSFYGPGDGYSILKAFLKDELHETNLEVQNRVNCFFIDNEAYRFLVAKKQGYSFSEHLEKAYKESWDKSAQNTHEMIESIIQLEPHNLQQTTSLNYARKLISEMAEPMVRLEKNIRDNIRQIETKTKQLENSKEFRNKLASNLVIEVDDLQMITLTKPKTVCTQTKCVALVNYNGQKKLDYTSNCHVGCYLSVGQQNATGQHALKDCKAMNSKGICNKCGCSFKSHMHATVEFLKVKRNLLDQNAQKSISKCNNSSTKIKYFLDHSKEVLKDYKLELSWFQMVAAKLAYLLLNHSNTSHNKFIEPYLDRLIDEEGKMASFVPNYPITDMQQLVNMKDDHKDLVKRLAKEIVSGKQSEVQLSDIEALRDRLFKLKHTGEQFRRMMDNGNSTKDQLKHFDRLGLDISHL